MIYEKDLDESIARYLGETDPSIETCRKLAACFTVKRELFGNTEQLERADDAYSFASEAPAETHSIVFQSGTEFSEAIHGRNPDDIWPIMDELMYSVKILVPKLYDQVMRKLR